MGAFQEKCARVREMGMDPDSMTLRQIDDALGIRPAGEPLCDGGALGVVDGVHASRFATGYERYDGDATPVLRLPLTVFWVGVKPGKRHPVTRHATNCYAPAMVYDADGVTLFYEGWFYVVPEVEEWAIQQWGADDDPMVCRTMRECTDDATEPTATSNDGAKAERPKAATTTARARRATRTTRRTADHAEPTQLALF